MSKWFSKQLGDGLVAYTPSTEIEEAFGPLYAAAGNPAEMAVFTRYDCAFSACKLVLPPGFTLALCFALAVHFCTLWFMRRTRQRVPA